jgi:ATP-binding cassette subfamily B protein
VFLIVLRPLAFGASARSSRGLQGPNLNVLVLSRLHRWTLGQAITFFDNDFAGRIAQKQMQTGRAVTEVTVEFINTVVFALASCSPRWPSCWPSTGASALLLAVWFAGYLPLHLALPAPHPRPRRERAAARAVVTGQVVDTITNMRTVKLFAHAEHEDEARSAPWGATRDRTLDYGTISTTFRFGSW